MPALSAIGYSEMIGVLGGLITVEDAVVLMKRRTRDYIRRQSNWFKLSDPNIQWFTAGETASTDVAQYILRRKAELTGD